MSKEITITKPKHFGYRLDLICKDYIGIYNDDILNLLIEMNPSKDFYTNKIIEGDVLIIPDQSDIYG